MGYIAISLGGYMFILLFILFILGCVISVYYFYLLRTYHKVLCVARTIADLDGKENIEEKHLKEALSYRTMNLKYWR